MSFKSDKTWDKFVFCLEVETPQLYVQMWSNLLPARVLWSLDQNLRKKWQNIYLPVDTNHQIS